MAKASSPTSLSDRNHAAPTAYDEVPYTSHPFPHTHPLLLQSIARLFGLSAPAPDNARILEIGCASGANIMSIASSYPKSRCTGIDYSQKQIELGRKDVEAVGLANLELKHMSVLDVTREFGVFDYILCHGVLSWVPPDVQEKIIEVCKTNLSADGIAYISYNTLPGWNSVRSVRDMMLYHTGRFADPAAKAQQARSLLKFMSDSTRDNKSPLASAFDREMQVLAGQPDSYLLHDHLEENNTAFYFHEFIGRAQHHGLQYLGDTSLETMFSGNFPESVARMLSTSGDLIRTEQYMDFLTDRRFRSTMLCHSDRILTRNVVTDTIRGGWMVSRFGCPPGFKDHDIASGQKLNFTIGTMTLSSDEAVALALLQALMEQNKVPVRTAELIKSVRAKLKKVKYSYKPQEADNLEEILGSYLLRYMFIGGVSFYVDTMPFSTGLCEKPLVSALARYQSRHQEWVTNQRQEAVAPAPFDRILLRYMDGANEVKALPGLMLPHFASGELAVAENNIKIEDIARIREKIALAVPDALQRIGGMALLVK